MTRTADYPRAIQEARKILRDNFITKPPVNVYPIAQNLGLYISERSFPKPKYNGVSGYIHLEDQTIVVNIEESANRKKFTIAHEIGHWVLHKSLLVQDPKMGILNRKPLGRRDPKPVEREANVFAAHLLIPDGMLDEFRGEDPYWIARIFGVSVEFVNFRLATEAAR
jgi:Zn-dependent peptidase ImmA (M78 family)